MCPEDFVGSSPERLSPDQLRRRRMPRCRDRLAQSSVAHQPGDRLDRLVDRDVLQEVPSRLEEAVRALDVGRHERGARRQCLVVPEHHLLHPDPVHERPAGALHAGRDDDVRTGERPPVRLVRRAPLVAVDGEGDALRREPLTDRLEEVAARGVHVADELDDRAVLRRLLGYQLEPGEAGAGDRHRQRAHDAPMREDRPEHARRRERQDHPAVRRQHSGLPPLPAVERVREDHDRRAAVREQAPRHGDGLDQAAPPRLSRRPDVEDEMARVVAPDIRPELRQVRQVAVDDVLRDVLLAHVVARRPDELLEEDLCPADAAGLDGDPDRGVPTPSPRPVSDGPGREQHQPRQPEQGQHGSRQEDVTPDPVLRKWVEASRCRVVHRDLE